MPLILKGQVQPLFELYEISSVWKAKSSEVETGYIQHWLVSDMWKPDISVVYVKFKFSVVSVLSYWKSQMMMLTFL